MTGLWRELRPYLALWPAVIRLAVGTWRLQCRLASLCMAGEGSDKLWRVLGLLVGAELLRRFAERAPLLMLPVTLLWLVYAWRAGPAPAVKPAAPADDDGQEQQEPADTPTVTLEKPPLPTRGQLVSALHQVADPHAQTVPLAAHLDTTTAAVREGLEAAGIPLTDGVRMKGRSTARGVRREHIPPLPSPASDPSPGVVAAGERAAPTTTTDGQGLILERPYPGMLIIRDPAEIAQRTHRVQRP